MPDNQKPHCPPVVLSTGCSKIKSYLSLRHPLSHPQPCPQPKHSLQVLSQQEATSDSIAAPLLPNFSGDHEAAVKAYWRRARELEQELHKIDKWLSTERKQRESLRNSMTGKARVPAIAENATTATEVLCQMASMRMEDLLSSLFESMSMTNISGCKTGECRGKSVSEGSEDGFMEAILLDAMEKMEGLVLQGLRIQIGSSSKAINIKKSKVKERNMQCIVLLMLIQVRDPMEDNGAVGEFMIGLIEASAAAVSARRFHIHGVHIAGIKRMRRTNGKDFIWSASAERCKGTCNSCCCQHVRNPDIVFAHES